MTSRAGYWIGGGLIAAAVVGAVLWGVLSFLGIGDTVDDFARAPVPGQAKVQLEARKYIVYVEGPGVSESYAPPVRFALLDAGGERALPVKDYGSSVTYSLSGHSGRAEATVRPPAAGTYTLRTATDVVGSDGIAVALGDSIAGRIVGAILGAFAIGGLGVAAGAGLIVTTAVRRRRRANAPPSSHAGIAGLPG